MFRPQETGNPFLKEGTLDTLDFRNALSDIKSDIDNCQALIAAYEKSQRMHDEVQMVMALSGLEIKMSNFARMMRDRFA
jgi:hypothetical protein